MEEQAAIWQLYASNAALAPARGAERWLSGYADASYKAVPPAAGGGWGCWVRDHHTRVIRSGPCPEWVVQSNDAELCACLLTNGRPGRFGLCCTPRNNKKN